MAWTANDHDLLTETEAKAAVSVRGTAEDDELSADNTAVARRLDRLVGPIVQRDITGERHDGGAAVIVLRRRPGLTSTLAITEYQHTTAVSVTVDDAGDAATDGAHATPWDGLDPDGELTSGRLIRRRSGEEIRWWPGQGNITVDYTAGRYENTAAVDPLFKAAAELMLQNLRRGDTPGVAQLGEYDAPHGNWPTYTVPHAVRELLAGEILDTPGVA